jgi:hypothetical protein
MSASNSTKNMAYDNPAYIARSSFSSVMAAGSGGVSGKFVAHAALLLFGLNAFTTTAGTSTYTATVTGSTTVVANTTALSLIRITNTAAANVAPALSTSTIGPFYPGNVYANGTATGAIGVAGQFALNTSTGTAGLGGLAINQGDQFYVVNGTDASAVNLITIDAQIQPLANVVA